MSKTSEQYRVDWLAADLKRDEGLVEPAEVKAFKNIPYSGFGEWTTLDLYKPGTVAEKLPVIISVHGGAFVYGSKEVYKFYLMDLARRGFATVNFNYRLAPEYQFPAALEDTNAVIEWVLQHAEEYGLDTSRIFMLGDSAGANYAALYTALCINPDYRKQVEAFAGKTLAVANFKPRALALNCGVYDLTEEAGRRVDTMQDMFGERVSEGVKLLNAIDCITAAFPPCYVMSGHYDFLKAHAPMMDEALARLGVAHKTKIYGSEETREIAHVFHLNMRSAIAKQCNDDECDFFKGI